MKIFSAHRKKLEPRRRYGGREFRSKVKSAANYKRVFTTYNQGFTEKVFSAVGLRSKFWRWVGLVVLLVILYYLIISSRFVVAQIQVSGNTQVSTQQIQDTINEYATHRLFLIKKGYMIFMTRGRIRDMLIEKIPTIKEVVEYKRTWPNSIELKIKERTPGFVLKSNEKYFLVDDEGIVVKQIDVAGNLLVVEDSVEESFASQESLPNTKLAPFIISMNQAWPSKLTSGVVLVKFPGKESNEVQFVSTEGWAVFFDINRSAAQQLDSLVLLLSTQIPTKDRVNLAYIDLRLSKWAYYCFKGSVCEQTEQPAE